MAEEFTEQQLNLGELDMASEVMGLWAQIMREWGMNAKDPAVFGRLVWDNAPSLGDAVNCLRNSAYATGMPPPEPELLRRRAEAMLKEMHSGAPVL